jgi:hypothetical protein
MRSERTLRDQAISAIYFKIIFIHILSSERMARFENYKFVNMILLQGPVLQNLS